MKMIHKNFGSLREHKDDYPDLLFAALERVANRLESDMYLVGGTVQIGRAACRERV